MRVCVFVFLYQLCTISCMFVSMKVWCTFLSIHLLPSTLGIQIKNKQIMWSVWMVQCWYKHTRQHLGPIILPIQVRCCMGICVMYFFYVPTSISTELTMVVFLGQWISEWVSTGMGWGDWNLEENWAWRDHQDFLCKACGMWMPSGSQWGSLKEFKQPSCLSYGISEAQSSSGM